jgi:hypothetical protein
VWDALGFVFVLALKKGGRVKVRLMVVVRIGVNFNARFN